MKYFKIQEFVSECVYKLRGERSVQLIDNRIMKFMDGLREALGKPITCNNWHVGGDYQWRGLRNPRSAWYSEFSQHTQGRAIDAKIKGMSAEEVRQWIIDNRNLEWVKPITFLEAGKTVTWLHADVRSGTNGDLWVWDKDTGKTTVYQRG